MPVQVNQADIVKWFLYDRLLTAAGANTLAEYRFFTVPIGGAKTKAMTNLEQVSQLTAPDWMVIDTLGFYFSSDMTKVDVDTFLNTYYMELWLGGGKIYAEGPLFMYPSGAGLTGVATINNVAAYAVGVPNPLAVRDLRVNGVGIQLLQGETIMVKVIGTPFALAAGPSIGLNLTCLLDGTKSRAVR